MSGVLDLMRQVQDAIAGVLVGGESRRMGRDKASMLHAHAGTFLENVVGVDSSVHFKRYGNGKRPAPRILIRAEDGPVAGTG